MNARLINVLCFLLLIGLGIWSLVLWHDGHRDMAIFAAVWAMLAPAILRSVLTL